MFVAVEKLVFAAFQFPRKQERHASNRSCNGVFDERAITRCFVADNALSRFSFRRLCAIPTTMRQTWKWSTNIDVFFGFRVLLQPMSSTRLIRNIPRMKEIATVAAKFGYGEVIRNTKIGDFLDKIKISHEAKHLSAPARFRLALESLGPTFMKLGQVLSMRPDLIPPDWSEEPANLQDSCPTVPWEEISKILEVEYPDGIDGTFSLVDEEPIGDGSMAQVHRAVTKDGR